MQRFISKNEIFLLIAAIFILNVGNVYSQTNFKDNKLKGSRKVEMTDRLDSMLNELIDKNEDLRYRTLSFSYVNSNRWRVGKIYTKENDTITGKIKNHIDCYGKTSMVLYFKTSKRKRYRADNLIGYECFGRQYRSKRISYLPPGFIEIIEKGELNLYFVRYNQPSLVVSFIKGDFKDEFYLENNCNKDEKLTGPVPSSGLHFQALMNNYLTDYPELMSKINTQKYTIKHIREIIQLYNDYKNKL